MHGTQRRLRLGSAQGASTLPHYGDDDLEFPPGLHWIAKTNEQSQRRARNLLPKMVFYNRPVYQEEHAAQLSSWPADSNLHQRPNTFAQTCRSPPSLFPCSRAADHTFPGTSGTTCPRSRLYRQVDCYSEMRPMAFPDPD